MTDKKVIKELIDEIKGLPEQIQATEFRMLGFSNNISTTEAEITEIENFSMRKIATERHEDNKKVFPNQEARTGELQRRLGKDQEYHKLKESMNFSKNELSKEKIRLNYLQNRFSACKYLTKLFEIEGGFKK